MSHDLTGVSSFLTGYVESVELSAGNGYKKCRGSASQLASCCFIPVPLSVRTESSKWHKGDHALAFPFHFTPRTGSFSRNLTGMEKNFFSFSFFFFCEITRISNQNRGKENERELISTTCTPFHGLFTFFTRPLTRSFVFVAYILPLPLFFIVPFP